MKCRMSLVLVLCLLLSAIPFSVAAEETGLTVLELNGIDTECRTGYLVAYTQGGTSTETSDKCVEAIVGADGRITAVGGHNNTVPEGGFILAGSGAKKSSVNSLSAGDGLVLDADGLTVTVVGSDYNPFFSTDITINGTNTTRKQDTIILYKDKATTETNAWGFEITVDADGYITVLGGNNSAIPEGGFVLSGHGVGKTTLSEAAKLGMKVTVSADGKSATLAFDKDGALEGYQTKLDVLSVKIENAKATYRLVDHDALKETTEALNGLREEMKDALQKDDMVGYVKGNLSFDKTYKKAEVLLAEKTPVEGRAVWIRPTLTADREAIFKTVKSIRDAGFNQVYVEIMFDNTWIVPTPEGSLFVQNPAFGGKDPLELYIEACHSYGIEIHAWMSVFRVGYKGSGNTNHSVGIKKPEWLNISKNGIDYVANEYGDAFFLNPALPEVREYLLEHYTYIVENYDLDGFQLDYVRYPNKIDGEDFGYDEYTMELYTEKYGKNPRTFSSGSTDYLQWSKFRASFVTEFVKSVHDMLAEKRPDMYLSAAVAPGYSQTILNMCQDPVTWMEQGIIDIVHPMAYGTTDAVIRYIGETVPPAGNNIFTIIGVSDQGAAVLAEQTLATRDNGTDGVAFFSWNVYDDDYAEMYKGLFATPALSPTYDGKAAVLAQLALLKERIETNMAEEYPSLATLAEAIERTAEELGGSTLSDCKIKLHELLEQIEAQELGANAKAALEKDCRLIEKVLGSNKDDAKAQYRKEHPLPDVTPDDESGAEKDPQEESNPSENENQNDGESGVVSDNESNEKQSVPLTPVENFFRFFSLIILFGGLALLPVYFVLNARKKRIIRSFDEPKENPKENPEEEAKENDNKE